MRLERGIVGFGEATVNNVEVVLGKTTPINIEVKAGGVAETVTVSADAVAIDPTDNKIQTNITAQVAELLSKGTTSPAFCRNCPIICLIFSASRASGLCLRNSSSAAAASAYRFCSL